MLSDVTILRQNLSRRFEHQYPSKKPVRPEHPRTQTELYG